MKITYIYHSSFCVEFEEEKVVFIFDYYKGDLPLLDKTYQLYMLASHKHFDHFSKKIFDLVNEYPNITFILSNDIKMNEKYMDRWNIPIAAREKIHYVFSNQIYNFLEMESQLPITINTLKSTDIGVAYIVECFGKTIYHAGDLNWWVWDELTEEENATMELKYKKEIDQIVTKNFDVAFIPLDPRQGDKFYWGFNYFMHQCKVKTAFPMHLWEKYETILTFKDMNVCLEYKDHIMDISYEGQSYII